MTAPRVLYFAPGSGLGHLNRALAVCMALRDAGCSAEIVSNSPFAEGIARAARFPVTHIRNDAWKELAPRCVTERAPRVAVTDTFPFGIRGEWMHKPPAPMVYVARRLRVDSYRAAVRGLPEWSGFARVIVSEPLSTDQEAAIGEGGSPVVRLGGPIRLAPGSVKTPIPASLERRLEGGRAWLVVHGGPEREVEELCRLARQRMDGATLDVIAPFHGSVEYFPAGNLVDRCAHVVSGAGYNIMADMTGALARHTAVAFERRFDDQAARLAEWSGGTAEGASEAATAILEVAQA